jgi:hypothetical protein
MERILFGDNQFFGVNHMSEEKARAQSVRFKDTKAIMEVLDIAYEEGIKVFMCTTHERIAEVCDHVRANPEKYADFQFYPCMPYAHKYANAVTEYGMIEALKRFLPGAGQARRDAEGRHVAGEEGRRRSGATADRRRDEDVPRAEDAGDLPAERRDRPAARSRLRRRLQVLRRLREGEVRRRARVHHDESAEAARRAGEVGIDNPIVCSNINKIGFRMCGGKDLYEKTIRDAAVPADRDVGAGVGCDLTRARRMEYVCGQPKIESIVFGASSRGNIRQTAQLMQSATSRETGWSKEG